MWPEPLNVDTFKKQEQGTPFVNIAHLRLNWTSLRNQDTLSVSYYLGLHRHMMQMEKEHGHMDTHSSPLHNVTTKNFFKKSI